MITVIAHYTAAAARSTPSGNCSPGTRLPHAPSRAACSSTPTRASTAQDEFALVERDESQAALAEHRRTPHLRRNVETALVALLTRRSWTVSGPALFGPAL